MREIRFRGKRIDNGEWVTGAYIHNSGKPFIISHEVIDWDDEFFAPEFWWRVDPSTVGQYTGLNDKNGKEVCEGDIVRMHYFFENYHPVTLGAFEDEEEIVCKLSITPLGVYFENNNMTGYLCDYLEDPSEELEVIGNIHDTPDLLKGTET